MPRPLRTLVLLSAIAIAGVAALAILAGRYRDALPGATAQRAAAVPPSSPPTDAAATTPEAPAGPATPAGVTDVPAGRPAPGAGAAQLRHVDAFIAARKAMLAAMKNRAPAMNALKLEHEKEFEKLGRTKMHLDVVFEVVMERRVTVAAKGSTDEDYARVLAAYRARRAGESVADPELAAALDARKDALAEADFGDYAFWDEIESEALR